MIPDVVSITGTKTNPNQAKNKENPKNKTPRITLTRCIVFLFTDLLPPLPIGTSIQQDELTFVYILTCCFNMNYFIFLSLAQ